MTVALLASMWLLTQSLPVACRLACGCMRQSLIAALQAGMRVVEAVVQRLLMVAVADINSLVRKTVLQTFKDTTDLDIYLAQADW